MKSSIIYKEKPNDSRVKVNNWVSVDRAYIGSIPNIYLSINRTARLTHIKAKGYSNLRTFRYISQIKIKPNEDIRYFSRLNNSGPVPNQYPLNSILNKFKEQLAEITEVRHILYSIEESNLDIYIVYDSSSLSVRFDIYKQAQLIISEAFAYGINVDLHTTNLADFDPDQFSSLIPSNTYSLLNR